MNNEVQPVGSSMQWVQQRYCVCVFISRVPFLSPNKPTLSVHKIWRLYLHPFQRHEGRRET